MNYYKSDGARIDALVPRRLTLTENKVSLATTPVNYKKMSPVSKDRLFTGQLIRTVPELYVTEDLTSQKEKNTPSSSKESPSETSKYHILEKSLRVEASRLQDLTKALENLKNGSHAMIMSKETEYRLLVESQKKELSLLEDVIAEEAKMYERVLQQNSERGAIFDTGMEFFTERGGEYGNDSPSKSVFGYE